MLNEVEARQWVSEKVIAIYRKLQQGKDVSYGERLRIEGQVELLLAFHLLDWAWLQEFINTQHQYYLGNAIDAAMWQWMHDDNHFYLPAKMQEAPVYKR